MAHDTPLVSGNLAADAARRGWPITEPGVPEVPASAMVLPLRLGGQVIGVLGRSAGGPRRSPRKTTRCSASWPTSWPG